MLNLVIYKKNAIFAKSMDRKITLTIYSIIIFMMLGIQPNVNLFIEKQEVDNVVDVCIVTTTLEDVRGIEVYQALSQTTLTLNKETTPELMSSKFPYVFKSQHLTCQHTRAGTLLNIFRKHLKTKHFRC